MLRTLLIASCLLMVALFTRTASAQDRETKVRNDRQQVEGDGYWIYNDLPQGLETAKASGKPLLVVMRCIPCEACAQLDEQVVERDPAVRALLDKFVCVRIVQANGLDLSLFQYDYDQSWAAFLMNADLTIYGRYGTRSHQRESENDVSLEGFAKALQTALDWHADYPNNKAQFAAKRGPDVEIEVPEDYPSLKGKYGAKLDYEGKVVQSCIHCHQVGEAQRLVYRTAGQAVPDQVLFPYPNPKILGLILDPKEKATVKYVAAGASGARNGFQAGDEIVRLGGQPILSIADVQWLLQHAGESGELPAEVLRDGKTQKLTLTLAPGWRKRDNISWRATSWDLRRMVTGGLLLEEATAEERRAAGISDDSLALRVKHVGQYGDHAVAKQAGVQQNDILIAVNGQSKRLTESDLLAHLAQTTKRGDQIQITVQRGNEKKDITLRMQ